MICSHCGGYLQTRIQTLDLFDTLWMLIESPRRAFKRICLAEQKNYIHFLAAVVGVEIVALWLWRARGGLLFENNLQFLILALILSGPLVGVLVLYAGSFVYSTIARLMNARTRFREVKAVLAYALIPLMLAAVFLVPIELGLFGMSLFTGNPSPMVLKPGAYIVLIGMNGLAVLWTFVLLVIGTRVLLAKGPLRSVFLALCTLAVIAVLVIRVPW